MISISLLILLVLVLFSVLHPLSAQFEDDVNPAFQQQQQQQQQITLTRDAIERILQMLSGNCRVEMEGALASQSQDISDNCKVEIQESLKHLSAQDFVHAGQQAMPEDGYEMPSEEDPFAQSASQRRAPRTNSEEGISPTLAIIGFVVALIAGAAGFIFYRISTTSSDQVKSPIKKISKKKEEKIRQKAQQRGY